MGERTSYTPGTFCWAELATTDVEGAKSFYGSVFGWEAQDTPAAEGGEYSMMLIDGKSVAAMGAQPPQQTQAGVPPMWQSYVSVESADASAEKAGELGGHVHAPPFDLMEAGRAAVIQDPQGAVFLLWEPKTFAGASLVNGPSLMNWNELASPDIEGSTAFYGELFGWKIDQLPDSPVPYYEIKSAAGRRNGGIREPQPGEPPNWGVYFGCDDVSPAMELVSALGGAFMGDPVQIATGTIGVCRDPQGAMFNLYAGEFEA
jgi:predicted enzyme related to lactoylglutathione lyase